VTIQRQVAFWILATVLAVFLLWLLRGILLPFVAGAAIAYMLDPVADRLERGGMNRLAATSAILAIFVLCFVLAVVLIAPVLGRQIGNLIENLPEYAAALQRFVSQRAPQILERAFGMNEQEMEEALAGLVAPGARWTGTLLSSLWSGTGALLNLVSVLLVSPVVAFYLLLDWDKMMKEIDDWLPRRHLGTLRQIGRDIDLAIAGFVRGQGTVCLLLGTFYAVLLTVVGLNFGLLIGFGAGLVSFIPYVGTVLGFVASVGVALFQFWPDWPWILAVIGIFALGQFIEGNILHPKLIGSYIGLHPVWMMFALFAFGYLFGFVGVLLAVPLAAVIGVLIRFALSVYTQSPFYTGVDEHKIRLPHEFEAAEPARPAEAAPPLGLIIRPGDQET